jgi:chemotaxis protein methyltransferase CheR
LAPARRELVGERVAVAKQRPDGQKGIVDPSHGREVDERRAEDEPGRRVLGRELGHHCRAKALAVVEQARRGDLGRFDQEPVGGAHIAGEPLLARSPGIATEAAVVEQQHRQTRARQCARQRRSQRPVAGVSICHQHGHATVGLAGLDQPRPQRQAIDRPQRQLPCAGDHRLRRWHLRRDRKVDEAALESGEHAAIHTAVCRGPDVDDWAILTALASSVSARVRDADCVQFLQWALPRLELRWDGFRKVRRQVCRRISRRLAELGLSDGAAYREYIEGNADEWDRLDGFCRITISRFWRDPAVFESLRDHVLPALGPTVSVWSAGCASGEEPYSLVLAAAESGIAVRVLATDVDAALLDRARTACYPESSLRGLPPTMRAGAFDDGCLRTAYREPVEFRRQDLRTAAPTGPFDLVLCRNIVFTYFAERLQAEIGHRLARSLWPGGALVVGAHEEPALDELEPWPQARGVWRRR